MLIMLSSCSAAGQGFTKFFVQTARVHEANFFVIKYLRVLYSAIYASHGIGHSVQWIMDMVEKCVRGFTFLIVSKPKRQLAVKK